MSEHADIEWFHPRLVAGTGEMLVWAVDAAHLRNYLLPRDCPRVTFSATLATNARDRQHFLGAQHAVVAIEDAWLERVRSATLYLHRFAPDPFVLRDRAAGYHVSSASVRALHVERIDDVIAQLSALAVELRVLPTLWPLHDAVAASSLEFSMIRMRNALPRASTAAR